MTESEIQILEILSPDQSQLEAIGRFRLEVWRSETTVDESLFPTGAWVEPLDYQARHWIAKDSIGVVGSARLTFHDSVSENPDGYLFQRANIEVPLPSAHFCKLVVHRRARGKGIASRLNQLRVSAAREAGAKSILVTASAANGRLLSELGFVDSQVRETFPNRPQVEFMAMKLDL